MGGVVKKIGGGLKGAIMGKKGSAEELPDFLTPEMKQENLQAAETAFRLNRQLTDDQAGQMSLFTKQIQDVMNERMPTLSDASNAANSEIERRRRALQTGIHGQNRALQQNIARRGLGGSAAGLFAQAQANRLNQGAMQDIEGARSGLQRDYFQQDMQDRIARQGALLGQQQQLWSGVQRITPNFMTPGKEAVAGQMGLVGRIGRDATNVLSGRANDRFQKGAVNFLKEASRYGGQMIANMGGKAGGAMMGGG